VDDLAYEIWDSKYRLKAHDGTPIDRSVEDTFRRVAKAVAAVEKTTHNQKKWEERFFSVLMKGAIPAGRIMANAGAAGYKKSTSLINCTVSDTIEDSMEGIMNALKNAGLILKAGCGIGYDFTTLRPSGALVAGGGTSTRGPMSFMHMFDAMCKTIASAGGRRGAQMACLSVRHPDIEAFIKAKHEKGTLTTFNLSCLVPDEFMAAVTENQTWDLVFPARPEEITNLAGEGKIAYHDWPTKDGYTCDDAGLVACKVHATVDARELWDLIMRSTYEYSEPGVLFIDTINKMNSLGFGEKIGTTNPCGEQPLPPNGSCLLGSIDLTRFVLDPFTYEARFDWDSYKECVRDFTRFLDNVVDIHGLPLPEQASELQRTRRHGMGFLGLGSSIVMLGLRYGDRTSIGFAQECARSMAYTGWFVSNEIANEKGVAPVLKEECFMPTGQWARKGDVRGQRVVGSELFARGHIFGTGGAAAGLACGGYHRFTHHTSIAPTGTIALAFANNASSGIEPSFAHMYQRRVLKEGVKVEEDVVSKELQEYRARVDPDAGVGKPLPEIFVRATDISPMDHLTMVIAVQKFVDSSISKTINVAQEYPFKDFKELYAAAHAGGLKGCTTYRSNPERHEDILFTKEEKEPLPGEPAHPGGVLERPAELRGATYKVKTPLAEHAMYVTINDTLVDGKRKPFEIFINSKSMENFSWVVGLTRVMSAVFRHGGDSAFLVDELKSVFDPRGGYFRPGGKYMPSLVAEIGECLGQHMGVSFQVKAADTERCSRCGSTTITHSEGCVSCMSCGHSKCGG
jgi:ribonucleoside-diphosphate reductase alpha chain